MRADRLDRGDQPTVSPWLASLMMRRGSSILPRFAFHYRRLSGQSRGWRRRLRRKLAVGVTGAALLLAMSGVHAQVDPAAPDATITVVNGQVAVAANGQCSLIEAIDNANATTNPRPHTDCVAGNISGADTIVLPNGGDFVLTAVHNTDYGPTGLPVINSTLTINGNNSTIRRGAGAPQFSIFAMILADLTLNSVTISNGHAGGSVGGAIYQHHGDLTINNSTITNNTADAGGAIFVEYGDSTTITNSQIINNTANGGSGGGLYLRYALATVTGSTISGNDAGRNGGGIRLDYGGITIATTTISGNTAGQSGGGMDSNAADVQVNRSTISGNSAPSGVGGGMSLYRGYQVGIVNSTISGNSAASAGGIYAYYYDPTNPRNIANSTITGNHASGTGGGLYLNGSTIMNRNIIAGNTASVADEVNSYDTGQVIVGNRNILGHAGINNAAAFRNFAPSATDVNATSNGTNTPLANILSPLAPNGGPTLTHALPAGSPARDLAPSTSCNNPSIGGVDQRGEPRNQNGAGGASANECDIGAFEAAGGGPPPAGAFFVSAATSGTMGGVAFAPADIIKFDPSTGWSMHFDGSDVGITKNVSAFEIQADNSILLSLIAGQNVPGVGAVAPHDVLRFVPTSTGNSTNGTFQMWVDGSTVGLTTAAEKIDGLGLTADNRIAISTTGALSVPGPAGGTFQAQDEDAGGFNRNTAAWSLFFNGTAIPGLGAEDVNALWVNTTTGDIYVSITGTFNLNGVTGDGKDIVKLTSGGGGFTPSIHWDGSAAGFPSTIDGLEIIP